ncbi:hypothetical protein NC653_039151 [Populus alba x Populus x berolinensis]|uniref:Uncharacterized protein n=1 Tax=Populus alba x Populus x berolinensis TaxID=444605 RepID=A0AAD6LC44_9ROSI|nr:hypothetical protein NC653_039151 [Populus alba x Populus x berolinensis]
MYKSQIIFIGHVCIDFVLFSSPPCLTIISTCFPVSLAPSFIEWIVINPIIILQVNSKENCSSSSIFSLAKWQTRHSDTDTLEQPVNQEVLELKFKRNLACKSEKASSWKLSHPKKWGLRTKNKILGMSENDVALIICFGDQFEALDFLFSDAESA